VEVPPHQRGTRRRRDATLGLVTRNDRREEFASARVACFRNGEGGRHHDAARVVQAFIVRVVEFVGMARGAVHQGGHPRGRPAPSQQRALLLAALRQQLGPHHARPRQRAAREGDTEVVEQQVLRALDSGTRDRFVAQPGDVRRQLPCDVVGRHVSPGSHRATSARDPG
jgi:hypothetical protein